MNERRRDFELLQRFTRHGEQAAFTDVVRRHLDLVFATAMRKVEDTGAAQEVAQNVFAALARKAWRFAPDDSLPAWLHKAALLESTSWLRSELGRRRREETASELGTTMKTPEDQPAFHALVPLLDEALLSLREKDRVALLLRFYESQSLREVGEALGAGEDAARKRVQGALEKITEFFKRRGFKTASVAAATAALQHTTVATSTAMVNAVAGVALAVAPPALVGLSALLARLASLSKVQTAAVCVALTAVPVGWQLNARQAAGAEVKRLQEQRLATQNEASTLRAELDRVRAEAARLKQSVAQATEAAARAAASAQAFADWKQRVRAPLLAADYRWDDNSLFVRIPKSVLPELCERSNPDPFSPPGVVESYARELMGLTYAERQAVETALQRHFASLEEQLAAGIRETNKPLSGRIVANRKFDLQPAMKGSLSNLLGLVLTNVRGVLGEERWPLVKARLGKRRGPVMSGDLSSGLTETGQSLEVWVETNDGGTPTMGYGLGGAVATGGSGALSMFLPEGDPKRTTGGDEFLSSFVQGGFLSNALRQRAVAWLQEQAIVRLGEKEKP